MKRLFCVVLVVAFATIFAVAQDSPKAEVFGGYQYTNVDTKGLGDRQNFNGWDADVAARVAKNISVVADVSGAYKSESGASLKVHSFLFGPRVSATTGKVTPFVQALFGVAHSNASFEGTGLGSSNNFGMTLGGGFDYNLKSNVAWRVAKFDYFMVRGSGDTFNNFRIATGLVFKF